MNALYTKHVGYSWRVSKGSTVSICFRVSGYEVLGVRWGPMLSRGFRVSPRAVRGSKLDVG